MHIVTKFLVVICAALSLLLAALTMAYAANADALVRGVASERTLRTQVEDSAQEQQSRWSAERVTLGNQLDDARAEIRAREDEIAALQAERADLLSQVEQAKAQAQSIRSQVDQLAATAQSQANFIGAYRDEVNKLRDDLLSSNRRETQQLDRINDLESAREVLEQNTRALQEQLHAAQEAASAYAAGGPVQASNGPRENVTGPMVRARVTNTFKSPDGRDMVVIDEGTNGGVSKNQLMYIVRDNNFVANLVITRVDAQESVGVVNTLGRDVTASVNDIVLSRLQ